LLGEIDWHAPKCRPCWLSSVHAFMVSAAAVVAAELRAANDAA